MMRSLAVDSGCLARHEHIFILGPTGIGKSYWARALAHKACRDGYTVFYSRAPMAACALSWPGSVEWMLW